jgi:general transcription factor 3C polypeptide 5 (transcription factor C subunit 1)
MQPAVHDQNAPAEPLTDGPTQDAAPYFPIPAARIVSVQHPCIIKNVDKATQMLGPDRDLDQTVNNVPDSTLNLRFGPTTPSITSFNSKVDNILIKFTVPKRVGKRKRGSDQPFTPLVPDEQVLDAEGLLRSIQDTPDQIQVTSLGDIENSHVFRSIPDFVYQPPKSAFTHDVETKLFSNNYTQIKSFNLPQTYGMENPELMPPPVLSTASLPQPYSYAARRSNRTSTKQPKSEDPYLATAVSDVDHPYPTSLPPTLPPLRSQSKQIQALIPLLTQLFSTRPLWTRRALINTLPQATKTTHLRATIPYLAYWIRSGPWKDTLCAYGTDPRTSPSYSIYQTIYPRTAGMSTAGRPPSWGRSQHNPDSHLYSGVESGSAYDNRLFQLCDISDPDLVPLIALPASSPPKFDPLVYGWYASARGAFLKLPVLMSAKLEDADTTPPREAIAALLSLPDHLTQSSEQESQEATIGRDATLLQLPEGAPEAARQMADEYRRAAQAAAKTIHAKTADVVRVMAALSGAAVEDVDADEGPGREENLNGEGHGLERPNDGAAPAL